MNRVAIIGSNSFSGATFCARALDEDCDVIAISRSPEPNPVFLPYRWHARDGSIRFHQFDINSDMAAINDLLRKEKPAYVVNFAAQSMVGQSWNIPEHWFQTNAVATTMLFNHLRTYDFLERYIHVTTPEVYGSTDGPVTENTSFNPSTPYAVSRAAGDMSLDAYATAYGLPAIKTRAANVFGAGQQLYRIIPRAVLFFRIGRTLQLHGGGASRRSFIDMRDVSDAMWRMLIGGRDGETYHIATDEIVSIRQLIERICAKMGVDFDAHVETTGDRLGKDDAYLLDATKIGDHHGWRPQISLDKGLDAVIDWVDRNLDVLKDEALDYVHKA